jgi:ABC-type uncharacterized transport system substrate-binding protein
LVSSLALPDGNMTGLSGNTSKLNGKLLEFSPELVPSLRRLRIIFNPENQLSARGFHVVDALAPVTPVPIATSEQLEPALTALGSERPQVLFVQVTQLPSSRSGMAS